MISSDISADFPIEAIDNDLGPYLFLREHTLRGHRHVVRRQFKRAVPRPVLPERASVLQTIHDGECFDVIADVDGGDGAAARMVVGRRHLGAADPDTAAAIVAETHQRVPVEVDERRLDRTPPRARLGPPELGVHATLRESRPPERDQLAGRSGG